jgi:DNA-binding NtrC family response regulator
VERDLSGDKGTLWQFSPEERAMQDESVLVVDDDRTVLHMVRQSLLKAGVEVVTASTAQEAIEAIRRARPHTVLMDIMLPDMSGLNAFARIRETDKRLPVIFITARGDSSTAIDAMQLGAYDYVHKPLNLPALNALVLRALESHRMMSIPVAIPTSDRPADAGDAFVGRSSQMVDVYKHIGRVAQQNVAVLIRGESGTGKELVARAIYQHSPRSKECFMAVNCAAIPDNLLESELFGHEKGSFTGADGRRIGKFEQCNGGTIFLDEVGDMSPLVQGKVLRLLQEQRFERVGGNQTIETNVRIIAATNRDLDQMVEHGEFRADLFYRLNGMTIQIPPLRDRPDDIPLLLEYFLNRFCQEMRRSDIEGISPDALQLLISHDWPGNIRELQSVIRQSLLNATGPVIIPQFLPDELCQAVHEPPAATTGDRDEQAEHGEARKPPSDVQPWPFRRPAAARRERRSLRRGRRDDGDGISSLACCNTPGATRPARRMCWASRGGKSATALQRSASPSTRT